MELNVLYASKIRQRIVQELSKTKSKELRVMTLVCRVGAKYNEVNRNLKILETEGIIANVYHNKPKHPKIRIIKLQDNHRTQKLIMALNHLKEENNLRNGPQ
jgi:predicted transcriptional regulator